ncbi:hypothetical protein C8J56DRAFT_821522 [Mycena floridula]|nr:hypothetical protein C8J56DRAFT_821522 [Mycena floridula]
MSETSERRTRSQYTLPETDLHLSRSPLKEARTAARNGVEEVLEDQRSMRKRSASRENSVDDRLSKRLKQEYTPSRAQRAQSVPPSASVPKIDFNQQPRSSSRPLSPFREFKLSIQPDAPAPQTPQKPPLDVVMESSPLTPVPETPFPPRRVVPGPPTNVVKAKDKPSRLPRRQNSAKPTSIPVASSSKTILPPPAPPVRPNAFDVMMGARASDSSKGKGKPVFSSQKVPNIFTPSKPGGPSNRKSVKDSMRPREKPKKLIPLLVEEDEEESRRSPSPGPSNVVNFIDTATELVTSLDRSGMVVSLSSVQHSETIIAPGSSEVVLKNEPNLAASVPMEGVETAEPVTVEVVEHGLGNGDIGREYALSRVEETFEESMKEVQSSEVGKDSLLSTVEEPGLCNRLEPSDTAMESALSSIQENLVESVNGIQSFEDGKGSLLPTVEETGLENGLPTSDIGMESPLSSLDELQDEVQSCEVVLSPTVDAPMGPLVIPTDELPDIEPPLSPLSSLVDSDDEVSPPAASPMKTDNAKQSKPPTVVQKPKRPAGRKRAASTATSVPRTTRSTSTKRRAEDDDDPVRKRMAFSSPTDDDEDASMKVMSSPAKLPVPTKSRTRDALPKTPTKPRSPFKSNSSPSPTKLSRSSSAYTTRDTVYRTFESHAGEAQSTLFTLSNALEKLAMPPPARPSTSMGFNPDDDSDTSFDFQTLKSHDDGALGRMSLKRSSTVSGLSSGESSLESVADPKPQFPRSGVARPKSILNRPPGRTFLVGTGSIMGTGRTMQKVSRNPSLPSVMASPVKGSVEDDPSKPTVHFINIEMQLAELGEKIEENPRMKPHLGRASLASEQLSRSLSALPAPTPMGPPVTPPRREGLRNLRSSSSQYPSSAPSGETSQSGGLVPVAVAKSAPSKQVKGPTLTVLKDCRVFVDVRSLTGEDISEGMIELLQGLGARIMKNAVQSCTHIVYKNGLTSTLNRYRSLSDPKPLVVGMTWVVTCAEAGAHVEETPWLVDLTGVNVAGVIKHQRRKSMIPKRIQDYGEDEAGPSNTPIDGDMSMADSSTSMGEDTLTPLERARLRLNLKAI